MTVASRVVAPPAQRYVRALEAPSDVMLVGGKAIALGRAMRAGLRVPTGFVLTTEAFDEHMRAHSAPMSSAMRDELFAAAETLLACGAVVVRSSAVGEDSRGHSFAGQLDSILHVTTLSALEEAVLACWASYWSERASFYRAAREVPSNGMGVVVQHQVVGQLMPSSANSTRVPPAIFAKSKDANTPGK